MKMTDHQKETVLKAQNEALTEKQMDFTHIVFRVKAILVEVVVHSALTGAWNVKNGIFIIVQKRQFLVK